MNTQIAYIIGGPGAGKSTAVAEALEMVLRTDRHQQLDDPFPHTRHAFVGKPLDTTAAVLHLGKLGGAHPGTDSLSNSAGPDVAEWLTTLIESPQAPHLVVGEGDRLTSAPFLLESDLPITVIYIDTDPDTARTRAEMRAAEHDSKLQDASWTKGRFTKVRNLVEKLEGDEGVEVIRIDGDSAALNVAGLLAAELFKLLEVATRPTPAPMHVLDVDDSSQSDSDTSTGDPDTPPPAETD